MKRLQDFADQENTLNARQQKEIRELLIGVRGMAQVILSLRSADGPARRAELRDYARWAKSQPLWTYSDMPPRLHQEVMAYWRILQDISGRNNRVAWYRTMSTRSRRAADNAYWQDLCAWARAIMDWLAAIDLSQPQAGASETIESAK